MSEQRSFGDLALAAEGKVTRRERFLAEMDTVIPWAQLRALIELFYPKAGGGRPPLGLEKCCGSISCSSGSIGRIPR